jgi:anaerobic magnesium-protoporphyrin IX monomethyl ester cyclase
MSTVTIVRMPSLFSGSAVTLSATPPIGVAYLASALVGGGHKVKVVDPVGNHIEQIYKISENLYVNGSRIDQIISEIDINSKFIGVSLAFSHEWPFAKKVIKSIKNKFPNSIIVCGGEHATAMYELCMNELNEIDYCILGEGESSFLNLIECINSNKDFDFAGLVFRNKSNEIIKSEYKINNERIRDIDKILEPAWDLIPLESYLSGGYGFGVNIGRSIPILASRGCPYQCTFCSNPMMWGTKWVSRSPTHLIEEMKKYIKNYQIKNFDFYDLTAIVKKKWIVDFCNLLIKENLNITWQLPSGTRSEAIDSEVTKLLYQSGCRNISYAPESGSNKILKLIKKKINKKKMIVSMRESIKNNLNVKANTIIGFPSESLFNIFETYFFIVRMAFAGVHDVSVWVFSAYPGSEIFNQINNQSKKIKFDDEYYYNLLSYSDLKNVTSWNENFSNNQLKYLRLIGFAVFYLTSFVIRPFRLFALFKNIYKRKPVSRLEMILEKAIFRKNKSEIELEKIISNTL